MNEPVQSKKKRKKKEERTKLIFLVMNQKY